MLLHMRKKWYLRKALQNYEVQHRQNKNNSCSFRQLQLIMKNFLIVGKSRSFNPKIRSRDKKLAIYTVMEKITSILIQKWELEWRDLSKLGFFCNFELSAFQRKDQDTLFFYWRILFRFKSVAWAFDEKLPAAKFQFGSSDVIIQKKAHFGRQKLRKKQRNPAITVYMKPWWCFLGLSMIWGLRKYSKEIDQIFHSEKIQSKYFSLQPKHIVCNRGMSLLMRSQIGLVSSLCSQDTGLMICKTFKMLIKTDVETCFGENILRNFLTL